MSCGVGQRLGLDLALLWLWCRPVATAPIRPLAWEPPYASGNSPRKGKKKKKKKRQKKKKKKKKKKRQKKKKKKKEHKCILISEGSQSEKDSYGLIPAM